jgi:diamine N-acetyltransferase
MRRIRLERDVILKPLEPADATLLHDIATQAYADHYADTWYDGGEWYLHTFLSAERLQQELQTQDAHFYLIVYQEAAVGFLKLNRNKPLPYSEQNALELERIYLTKAVSGKGIGTAVMHWVFDFAAQEKAALLWLKVMDTAPDAVRFYEKLGFKICGTHQVDFPQKKEGLRGMYLMCKSL